MPVWFRQNRFSIDARAWHFAHDDVSIHSVTSPRILQFNSLFENTAVSSRTDSHFKQLRNPTGNREEHHNFVLHEVTEIRNDLQLCSARQLAPHSEGATKLLLTRY